MTELEAGELITTMQFMYIESFKGIKKEAIKAMAKVWSISFANESLTDCLDALQRHANVSEFVPKMANIRKELNELNEVGTSTASEAWEKCFKVAMDLPFYAQATWNLEDYGLSKIELKVLKSINVMNIKMSQSIGIERSNFIKMYKEEQEREEKELKMPDNLKSLRYRQRELLDNGKGEERTRQIDKKESDNDNIYLLREAIGESIFIEPSEDEKKLSPLDRIAKTLGVKRKRQN